MALSKDLINQFVKLTTPEQQPTETTVNGTYKKVGNVEYVQIDGSDILTPVESTVTADNDDRVQVLIKNHKATITGNITSPSARHKDVSTIKDEVDEFGNTIKQMDNIFISIFFTDFFIHFLHLFFVQGDADVAEIFSQKFRRQHLRIASHLHICHKFS